jgi:hypothetical protein
MEKERTARQASRKASANAELLNVLLGCTSARI